MPETLAAPFFTETVSAEEVALPAIFAAFFGAFVSAFADDFTGGLADTLAGPLSEAFLEDLAVAPAEESPSPFEAALLVLAGAFVVACCAAFVVVDFVVDFVEDFEAEVVPDFGVGFATFLLEAPSADALEVLPVDLPVDLLADLPVLLLDAVALDLVADEAFPAVALAAAAVTRS